MRPFDGGLTSVNDDLIPRATEVTTVEYIDLALQSILQNPTKTIAGSWGILLVVLVVLLYRRGTIKQP
jgi:hypothetical protein